MQKQLISLNNTETYDQKQIQNIYKQPKYQKGKYKFLIEQVINLNTELEEELINVGTSGFIGDKDHDPELSWHWWFGESLQNYDDIQRRQLGNYHTRFCIQLAYNYGQIYVVKDLENSEIAGISLQFVLKEDQEPIFSEKVIQEIENIVGIDPNIINPQSFSDSSIITRGNYFQDKMEELHLKNAQPNHNYLLMLSILPKYQGRGYGVQLLNKFTQLSQQNLYQALLQCTGERVKNIYANNGYKVIDQTELKIEEYINNHLFYCLELK